MKTPLEELLDWIKIRLSAESKLGASDEVIKALLSVKYKIELLNINSNISIDNDKSIYIGTPAKVNSSKEYDKSDKMTLDVEKGTISIPKSAFKMSTEQRLTYLLHECAAKVSHDTQKFRKQIDYKAENIKYFENFPFDEQAVRDFLKCKQEGGYFSSHDVYNDKLIDMLNYPDDRGGFRILNVTVGKGTHDNKCFGNKNYEVNENEVYITYNTMYNLCGGIYTSVMTRINGKNKIINGYCHARS